MILIFDLDDTLYEEITFVRSGFYKVAEYALKEWGIPLNSSIHEMNNILVNKGRGKIFNEWLSTNNKYNKRNLKKCISLYRSHIPDIKVCKSAEYILNKYHKKYSMYIVTDGNKLVQYNKIAALKISQFFNKVFITHRYGLQAAKPSIYCFKKIKNLAKCDWKDMLYVGDNPNKDFVNLKPLQVKTIRILKGSFSHLRRESKYEADLDIYSLYDLPEAINSLFCRKK